MTYFAICFLAVLLATLFFIMRSALRHGHLSAGHDLSRPQQFHAPPVPRLGGAGNMAAIVVGAAIAQLNNSSAANSLWLLTACSLPAFVSLITAGAALGFFVWNFPAGLIFLGDGGAYLLGFLLAELSILLIYRNPAVSPIFALLLCLPDLRDDLHDVPAQGGARRRHRPTR